MIIGTFQKSHDKSETRRARVLKRENNQWGFIDQTGKEAIPAKYLSVGVFNIFGYAKVRENISLTRKVNCGQPNPCIEKENLPFYYFIDKNGVQRSNYFENINDWDDNEDYFIGEINKRNEIVRKKDMHVICQSKGNTRLSIDASRYKLSDYFIKESRNDGKKDLVDIKGHHLTNFLYEDVIAYNNFCFGLVKKDNVYTWYLLNKDLKPYGEDFYTETEMLDYNFSKDVITLQQKEGFFLINDKGKIISEKYKSIRKTGDLFAAFNGKFTGLIDKKGRIVVPFEYSQADYYKDGVIILSTNRKDKTLYSFYNIKTKKLLHKSLYIPYKKYIVVEHNKNFGILNQNLKPLIPEMYKQIQPLGDTGYFLAVNQQDKMGLLNRKNKVAIPFIYDSPYHMLTYNFIAPKNESEINTISEYWLCFKKDDTFGILNYKGDIIIPFEHNIMTCFSVIAVSENGKLGLITKSKKRIPAEYDYHVMADGEKNGFYFVKKEGKLGAVDENNQVVIPFEFENVDEVMDDFYAEKFFVFRKRFGYSLVQKDGKMFYPYDFEYEPPKMKEGITIFDNKILYDIYKNEVNIYEAEQEYLDKTDYE